MGSDGGTAYLFVTTITGTATNATITVQSDDNTSFTSPATEGTFTFSDEGVYVVTMTGRRGSLHSAELRRRAAQPHLQYSELSPSTA